MDRLRYALAPGEPKRLQVIWTFKSAKILLDGAEVGSLASSEELKSGREFPLPDGTRLWAQLDQILFFVPWILLRDGRPLPGSSTDADTRIRKASGAVIFIGVLYVVLNLILILLVPFEDARFRIMIMFCGGLGVAQGIIFWVQGIRLGRRAHNAMRWVWRLASAQVCFAIACSLALHTLAGLYLLFMLTAWMGALVYMVQGHDTLLDAARQASGSGVSRGN
jgi:hypothetical protein